MPDTYKPATVRFLATVVERHCKTHGIVRDADRENVAARAIGIYRLGIREEDQLLQALENKDTPAANSERL